MANAREGTARLEVNVGPDSPNTREAPARLEVNVGPDSPNTREGSARLEKNVGVATPNAREAYARGEFGDVSTNVPTPHIWYVRPTFGREGWEFKVVGHGFGATEITYADAKVLLNALECGVIDWDTIAGTADALIAARRIDPPADDVDPEHEEIRATVPVGGQSGLIFVQHDEP